MAWVLLGKRETVLTAVKYREVAYLRGMVFKLIGWSLLSSLWIMGPGLTPTMAQGKGDLRISLMRVSIWPEYDDPRVLVMYQGQFAAGSPLPAPVRFQIPQGAEIHMAGSVSPQGEHQHQPFEVSPARKGAEVSYNLATTNFYMEFYYNPFKGGEKKGFEYLVQSIYPIDKLEVDIQQPLRANDFRVDPKPLSVISDQRGFKYSRYAFERLAKDREVKLRVSYTKADPNPSVEKATAGMGAGGVTERSSRFNPYVIILSVTASILIAMAGYYLLGRRRGAVREVVAAPPEKRGAREGQKRFCNQCGQEVATGDNFCSNCGARLRKRG